MKLLICWVCIVLVMLQITQSYAFENLDFEQVTDITLLDNHFQEGRLPGWTFRSIEFASDSGSVLNEVDSPLPSYDPDGSRVSIDGGHIGTSPALFMLITDWDFFDDVRPAPPAITGKNTILIAANHPGAIAAQVGTVPDNARSVRFLGSFLSSLIPPGFDTELPLSELYLFLGGERLDVVELEDLGGYKEYGANIPAPLMGSTTELRFALPRAEEKQFGQFNVFQSGVLYLREIRFSPIPVPEPATIVSLASGLLLLSANTRRRR